MRRVVVALGGPNSDRRSAFALYRGRPMWDYQDARDRSLDAVTAEFAFVGLVNQPVQVQQGSTFRWDASEDIGDRGGTCALSANDNDTVAQVDICFGSFHVDPMLLSEFSACHARRCC